jgi:hypothetical protein
VPNLDLESSPHSKVYAEIVRTLREDGTLRTVVRNWSAADGSPTDVAEPARNQLPAITLRPAEGPERFYGPQGMIGPLFVDVECIVAGTNAVDAMDLYHAVRLAIYPRDATLRLAIHQALVAAGAEAHYVVRFTQGRFAPREGDDDGAYYVARGQIEVNVTSEFNP